MALFKAEFLKESPQVTEELFNGAREYNIEKCRYQGIGRCAKEDVYQSGIDDLKTLSTLLGSNDFFFLESKSIRLMPVVMAF